MKEQYQREMSRVHVPDEVLDKTKQAMKRAEKEEKGKTVIDSIVTSQIITSRFRR